MENRFIASPTVGNEHNTYLPEDNAGVIQNADQRTQRTEQQGVGSSYFGYAAAYGDSRCPEHQTPKRKKVKWGKIKKFFVAVIKPILIFIPNFLNAVANLKRAFAPAKAAL